VNRRGATVLVLSLIGASLVLAGCQAAPPAGTAPTATSAVVTVTATAAESTATAPPRVERCAHSRLTIGDLPAIDEAWEEGLADAATRAKEWQDDARLVGLRVGCRLLDPGFRWQGRFYSSGAQSYYLSDTGETTPAEIDPAKVQTLPTDDLSFKRLHRALTEAGYDETIQLMPVAGVEVRLNTEEEPFAPPDAPKDVVYYHVAVDDRGKVTDLFVGTDGEIHRY
jgi:hypothetical protein